MRVLIAGAGIAGLTLAHWLHRWGAAVLLVERTPALRDAGYMIDMFGSGFDVAERMGLLPELARIHYQIPSLTFVDGAGREKFTASYYRLRRLFDDRHFNFMRGELERVLYDSVAGRVEIRFGTTVGEIHDGGRDVRVTLSDGSTHQADLVVGADGVHSEIRRRLFGNEGAWLRDLGYTAAAYIMGRESVSELRPDVFYALTEPGRQVGLYPIHGGQLATFFLHETAREPAGASPAEALAGVYGDMQWVVPRLLDALDRSTDLYYDRVVQVELPSWRRGRVTLLGDACQCVSLLAGQGASLAMGSAYVLAHELESAGGDVSAALARYQQIVQPAAVTKQRAGRRIARWFVPPNRWRLGLRNLGVKASTWGPTAWVIKQQLAGDSILHRYHPMARQGGLAAHG